MDLRNGGVTVRLFSHDVSGLTDRDVALARQISTAARQLGAAAEPTAVQVVQVTVDAMSTRTSSRSGGRCSATTRWATRTW